MGTGVRRWLAAAVAGLAIVAVLAGCAQPTLRQVLRPVDDIGAEPSESPAAVESEAEPVEPEAQPAEPDQPLLTISGTVADREGQSLTVRMTLVGFAAVTSEDRADLIATRCAYEWLDDYYAAVDASIDAPDSRMVTLAVEATASPGFDGWTDDRGIIVMGSVFQGEVWSEAIHGSTACPEQSKIYRAGSGTVRMLVDSRGWNVTRPIIGDGTTTLAYYGLAAQNYTASGEPTGTDTITDCLTEASSEFDAMAAAVASEFTPSFGWGDHSNAPEHCFYGRVAGDG